MKIYENGKLYAKTIGEFEPAKWDDLRVPLTATRRGGSKDPDLAKFKDNGAGSQGVFIDYFDKASEEELYFECQLPHKYKLGTDLHAHVHWTPASNGAEGSVVNWGLEYTFCKVGCDFSDTTVTSGNTHMIPDASLVAGRHYLTEVGVIDGSSVDSVSAMLICRVFRDATGALKTDDYDSDAGLFEVDFHYQIDAAGSTDEYIK